LKNRPWQKKDACHTGDVPIGRKVRQSDGRGLYQRIQGVPDFDSWAATWSLTSARQRIVGTIVKLPNTILAQLFITNL
jgi:hypothetical protein